jgi:signal transduction histidine kinase
MKAWKQDRHLRRTTWILFPLLVALATAGLSYLLVRAYVLRQAEANIRDVLLSHRGFHLYLQRSMHPEFYRALEQNQIAQDYYSPVILSSSYIVRVMHGYFNEERIADGLQPVHYKMAASNPRNPLNQANAFEASLIRRFDQDRTLHDIRQVLTLEGKPHLMRAIPFLPNTQACLRCHGRREDAPRGLRALYPGEGGFHETLGTIRAIEVVRVPIRNEIQTAALISAFLSGGLLGFMLLVMFNGRLRSLVRSRTTLLEQEVQDRRSAEQEVRNLNESLEARVEERTAQLARANQDLDAFASSLSHDLRTPLRSIDGYSRILEEDCKKALDPEGRKHLGRIRDVCRRMDHLIDAMLSLARMNRQSLNREELDLSTLAGKIIGDLRALDPGRAWDIRIAPDLRAWGDPALMQAVLENLIGNAFKFSAKVESPSIEIGQSVENGHPVFFIRDNGAGFDMQHAHKLFTPFQRLHSQQEFEGSGVGLATVRRILERHGGGIRAHAEPGKGSTFSFWVGPDESGEPGQ